MSQKVNEPGISFRIIPADCYTPVGILDALNARMLLESAYHETGKGKHSILVIDDAFTVAADAGGYAVIREGVREPISATGFLEAVERYRVTAPMLPDNGDYFPVPVGGTGYLGYEYFGEAEDVQFAKERYRDLYDSAFIFGRTFMVFDHTHDRALIAAVRYAGETGVDTDRVLDELEARIKASVNRSAESKSFTARIVSPDDRAEFIGKVQTVKDEIYKGNLLQCVLSRMVQIESDITPVNAYRNLRMKNPSPYMFFLNFGTFQVYGASPEVMVKVKADTVIVRPIAGTAKRGKDAAEDVANENWLKNDIKERAEHLMLIDLGRNDVGRVSVGGTVSVPEMMVIERYSRVMHLVSEVRGKKEPGRSVIDVVKATFPAGTVSGAPKIQAVKTIEALETKRRGVYSGLVGYFESTGDFDSCIVIRSAVQMGNTIYLQAGAGIVYDSVPEKEYDETNNKMRSLLDALNISLEAN
jgi:anthranilate synthase component I